MEYDYIRKIKTDRQEPEEFRRIFPAKAVMLWDALSDVLREHLKAVQAELRYETHVDWANERAMRFHVIGKIVSRVTVTLDVEAESFLIATEVINSLSQNFGSPTRRRIHLGLDDQDAILAYIDSETERLTPDQIAELVIKPTLAQSPALGNVQDLRPRKYA